MAYEIHLGRFSEDLQKVPISKQEWRNCAEKLEGLRFIEGEFPESIETYSEQYQDWIPVFWISNDGSGFMRSSGFFQSEVSYERAVQIATHLKAFVYGDEGEIYFLPGYGILYDDVERENPELNVEDLRRYKTAFGSDYKKIIATVAQEKLQAEKQAATGRRTAPIPASKPKHQNKAWILLVALLAALAIIYLLVKG